MKALVTGGAGFIGSNLVDALRARGDQVAVIDDLSSGKRSNLESAISHGAVLHEADVRDARKMLELFEAERPDVVFHLAAQIDVRISVMDPALDARTNVEGTINLLAAARQAGARRFVFASTGGAIYGETDIVPTPETVQPAPMAPYGTSKYCAEQYLGLYDRLFGLSTVAMRFGNVYGPRQDPHGEAGVVAIFSTRIGRGEALTVFGDGEQTRDYVYVGDVVNANLLLSEADLPTPTALDERGFNVGTMMETSVNALADTLMSAAGRRVEVRHADARAGEVMHSCLDISKLRSMGWAPRTSLHDGLGATYRFINAPEAAA